jgi:hypothetical protein
VGHDQQRLLAGIQATPPCASSARRVRSMSVSMISARVDTDIPEG